MQTGHFGRSWCYDQRRTGCIASRYTSTGFSARPSFFFSLKRARSYRTVHSQLSLLLHLQLSVQNHSWWVACVVAHSQRPRVVLQRCNRDARVFAFRRCHKPRSRRVWKRFWTKKSARARKLWRGCCSRIARLTYDDKGLQALITLGKGDMRRSLNILQVCMVCLFALLTPPLLSRCPWRFQA